MKVIALLFCCVIVAQANDSNSKTLKLWEEFKIKHNKVYGSKTEEDFRFKIFAENLKGIDKHNKQYEEGKVTYKTGINRFTDMLRSEIAETMLMSRKASDYKGPKIVSPLPKKDVPDTVDWRTEGAVTPVKDQGDCGSCWAFSAIGSTEGAHFMQTGELVALSEQNVMDCSTGTNGCNGGWENLGLEYIADNGGVDTEESYPYTAKDGTCHFDPANIGAITTGVLYTVPKDEEDLKNTVATLGPVSVGIDAWGIIEYESGILKTSDCDKEESNHAMTLVGYGTEDGQDYWLVKNSWGAEWGEEGYIRMARNYDNMCGIASRPCYPSV